MAVTYCVSSSTLKYILFQSRRKIWAYEKAILAYEKAILATSDDT